MPVPYARREGRQEVLRATSTFQAQVTLDDSGSATHSRPDCSNSVPPAEGRSHGTDREGI
ncbi:hypothetical protein ZHAS_00008793 [Anopheles sinensis]|uniref:Uncharacterized protein n=1 Tax=Anopheles sinensis TaxID=74873 RepID=A0A084VTC6_ANOSI|nr:hypothetical protein ZHAS_00008793 [Anopheles sinensis]